MSIGTKASIRNQDREGKLPGWRLYEELTDADDVVYLELNGVKADVTMIEGVWSRAGSVLLRLPAVTTRQVGLVPADWKHDNSWSTARHEGSLERLRRLPQKTNEDASEEP